MNKKVKVIKLPEDNDENWGITKKVLNKIGTVIKEEIERYYVRFEKGNDIHSIDFTQIIPKECCEILEGYCD